MWIEALRELKAPVVHPSHVQHKTVAFGHCSLQSQTPSTACFQELPEILQQPSWRGVKNGYCVELRQRCTAVTGEVNQKGAVPPLTSLGNCHLLNWQGHILTFLLIHWQERNSVCITVWAASCGMFLSSSVIRLTLPKRLKPWVWKYPWLRKDIRANSSSIIRVWHEEMCCCIFLLL